MLRELLVIFLGSETHNLRPTLYQAVVRKGFSCPFFALTNSVQAIGEFACNLGLAAEFPYQLRRYALTTRFQNADQVMHYLPRCKARVSSRVPVRRQFSRFQQS